MHDGTIIVERRDTVLSLLLNRPESLNSFTMPMARALQERLDEAERDDGVRVVVLSGAGRAFCAGQDLAEALPRDGSQPPAIRDIVSHSYNPIIRRLRSIGKPVICAVNGVAAGAGANIAFACDFVIAARNASFTQAFIRIGLIPDSGGTWLLPRLAGPARATAMAMLGDRISAEQALAWGLIHQVCEAEQLGAETAALAQRLAALPGRALALIKQALNAAPDNALEAQLELEERLQAEAGESADYREGVNAFLEKRTPRFTGK